MMCTIGFNLPTMSCSCIILDTVTFGVSLIGAFFSWYAVDSAISRGRYGFDRDSSSLDCESGGSASLLTSKPIITGKTNNNLAFAA